MRRTAGFVALVAPWLAGPGDRPMRRITLALLLAIFIAGAVALGFGGVLAIRELLPSPSPEAEP